MAENERTNIRQRQAEGIVIAKNKGIKFGRPKKEITPLFMEIYPDWKQKKITSKESMKILQMKPNTFYRRIKEYEESCL